MHNTLGEKCEQPYYQQLTPPQPEQHLGPTACPVGPEDGTLDIQHLSAHNMQASPALDDACVSPLSR